MSTHAAEVEGRLNKQANRFAWVSLVLVILVVAMNVIMMVRLEATIQRETEILQLIRAQTSPEAQAEARERVREVLANTDCDRRLALEDAVNEVIEAVYEIHGQPVPERVMLDRTVCEGVEGDP